MNAVLVDRLSGIWLLRMRNGWRKLLASLTIALLGTIATAASPNAVPKPGVSPAKLTVEVLTVEVNWKVTAVPPEEEGGVDLELTEGRVVDAIAWETGTSNGPRPQMRGWRLGDEQAGRVRVQVEAPLGASLVLRTFGKVVRIPLQALLDGQQRPLAQGPLEVSVERLPWDSLAVDLEQGDGIAVPGGKFPVTLGYSILTPEATEVSLRCVAELRPLGGGEPIWRDERQEVVPTNVATAPIKAWDVPAPPVEGTYVLEVQANWEPLASGVEHTRLGRWLRRRRNSAATSATRRVTLAVAGAKPPVREALAADEGKEVEKIDLARLRGQHPTASGRTPLPSSGPGWAVPEAALVEATRRDRLRGWITRAGSETAVLGPADNTGLAWSALGLKVPHPGRPHRLTLSVVGGHPSALGVAMVGSGGQGGRARLLLDACASGPPILDGGTATTFSWLVWPDVADPVLVLVNRDTVAPVQVGTVALAELSDVPTGPAIVEPKANARNLGLYLSSPEILDRFGSGPTAGDALAMARNLTHYLTYCGATSVVLPMTIADRNLRRGLAGQAAEDATGPDRLEMLMRILARQRYSAWVELTFDGALPGLPAPASEEAASRGLVRVDRHGQLEAPVYHPLHPEVRQAMKRRVIEATALRKSYENLTGFLIRLGPGPTLLGAPDTGFDDITYGRFVREAFGPETTAGLPGLNLADPNRFNTRTQFLSGPGRMPWLTWRSKGIAALYAELSQSAREASPGVVLAVATPGLDDGSAGSEARRVDVAGLAPSHAWRAVGLDLETWSRDDKAPIVLRGAGLSADDLAHDLATSPELDALVVGRPGRGLLLLGAEEVFPAGMHERAGGKIADANQRASSISGLRMTALPQPDGVGGDELMGHALAALDPRWVMFGSSTIVGQEDRVRRFARVFRALPVSPVAGPALDRQPFGVAVRMIRGASSSYLSMANDTPYPIRLETLLHADAAAPVDDLGRGLRLSPEAVASGGSRVVLDLPPFGVAAIRVGTLKLEVGAVTPYPSEVVLAGMRARYDELSSILSKLNQPSGAGLGPANPGFEPSSAPLVQLTGARAPTMPSGWQALAGMGNTVELDPAKPHSGRGSLKVSASVPPAAIASEYFPAKGHSALNVQAWFRSVEPDTKVRAWIEGEAGGQPFLRWSELTVQPQWSALGIRVLEIPPGGLDRVRLRFELVTGGTLWVDDVAVGGAVLTEPERVNARLVLIAAIHAYREKRYADFARLASSHWARTPGISGVGSAETNTAERNDMIRTGKATALPPGRLLR